MKDDFAIVIGLQKYQYLPRLEGPEADANDFLQWLLAQDGGDVPDDHVVRVLSSSPKYNSVGSPNMEDIEEEFVKELEPRVKTYIRQTALPRRLYIFMAGHGLCWSTESAALLTANADYNDRRERHVAGHLIATDWFRDTGYFREVVLVMDCCRSEFGKLKPRDFWSSRLMPDGAKSSTTVFIGFATKGGFQAREVAFPGAGPVPRGIFTYLLMEGLRSLTGDVTAGMLIKHVKGRMSQLPGGTAKQDPYLTVVPGPEDDFIWVTRGGAVPALPPVNVRIHLTAPLPESGLEVLDGTLTTQVAKAAAGVADIDIPGLAAGIYHARWPDTNPPQSVSFEVTPRPGGKLRVVINLNEYEDDYKVTYA